MDRPCVYVRGESVWVNHEHEITRVVVCIVGIDNYPLGMESAACRFTLKRKILPEMGASI
jgi:hypothetical protein